MPSNRRNLAILFVTLVVIMLGFGMIIPILSFLVDRFGASGRHLGLLMSVFAITQFIFSPIWGSLSDRYGRKPILMIGVLGNAIAQLFFGLSTELCMLFAARALSGILSSATLPTAMAYISDSTSEEERSRGMGMLGAAMGTGMVLGPVLGGWLGETSLSTPFFVAAGLSVLVLAFIALALPESLPENMRQGRGGGLTGPQFGQMWRALSSPIGLLLFLAFLVSFGLTNFEAIFGLYALKRFGYGPKEVGTVLAVIGLIFVVVQGGLTGPLTKRWGEALIIKASLLGSVLGFLVMLLANSFATVLLTVGLFVFGNAMLRPVLASLISKRATTGQGVAMGLNNSFMSLGRMVGPIWAGFIFDLNFNLPYVSGSIAMLIGFFASMLWLEEERPQPPEVEPQFTPR
jgi:DHA1 family multidrug resistance protein-like MFS transporter